MSSLTNLCLYNLALPYVLQGIEPLEAENIPVELQYEIKEIYRLARECIEDSAKYFKYIIKYSDLILFFNQKKYFKHKYRYYLY